MKAATVPAYGPPDVLRIAQRPDPVPGPYQVLIEIHASVVTTGDWRLRAAAFPGGLHLVGRLVSGLWRPRHEIPGVTYSGVVLRKGADVTRFEVGEAVFGTGISGGHAELIAVDETSALARKPAQLDHAQAAALPFGGATSYHFLKTLGQLTPGAHVLVTGASGGVGHLGVQLAKALGAHVAALTSRRNEDFVRRLGADVTLAYDRAGDAPEPDGYDAIFDTIGHFHFAQARKFLRRNGRFLAINGGPRELLQMLVPCRPKGRRVKFGVSEPDAEELETLSNLAATGELTPVIEARFALDDIAAAHRAVETRHRRGVIALEMKPPLVASSVA